MKVLSSILMVVFIFASLGGTKAESPIIEPKLQKRTTTEELIQKTDCYKLATKIDKLTDSLHIEVEHLRNDNK